MNQSSDFGRAMAEWMEVCMKRSMHDMFLYAKERGFSMSQIGALMHISRKGVSGIANIGDNLGITSAAVSQMIDRLVQQNLIARTENPDDRRAKCIELTAEGIQVVRECTEARQRWLDSLATLLSDDERRLAVDALRLLIDKTLKLENETL
jgi:DNA-binding MarR family transcriptional regulator